MINETIKEMIMAYLKKYPISQTEESVFFGINEKILKKVNLTPLEYTPILNFFTGNTVQEPRSTVVMISSNPKFKVGITLEEMKGNDNESWHDNPNYFQKKYQDLPRTFKKMVLILKGMNNTNLTKENIVNIDICPYYSRNTNFIGKLLKGVYDKKISRKRKKPIQVDQLIIDAVNEWNKFVLTAIKVLRPRFVFVHGNDFRQWLRMNHIPNPNSDNIENNLSVIGIFNEIAWLYYFSHQKTNFFWLDYATTAKEMNMTNQKIKKIGSFIAQKLDQIG